MRLPQFPFLHHDPPEWQTAAEEAAAAEEAKTAAAQREAMKRQPMKRKSTARAKKASDLERALVLVLALLIAAALIQTLLSWAFGLPGLSSLVDAWHWLGEHWQSTAHQ